MTPEPTEPSQPTPDAFVDNTPTQTQSTSIAASSFDRYCTRDDECTAVFEGNACDPDRCANTAIRRDALPKYRSEIGAYWSCYTPSDDVCPAVIGDPAACVNNTCVAR